jgi:SAM-dependent methyltransferase
MRILELPECPACGAGTFSGFELGPGHPLRRCQRCGTVSAADYADPDQVYVDGYMFGEAGPFGLDVRGPGFQRYLMRVARRRVGILERASGLRFGALLDVGSGTGEVLLAAGERGWRARGVEPERTAAEMARLRGLSVTVAGLEESGLPERAFDVISAFHVLEHIPDSRAFLRTMARWARPGGFVAVEVPNFASVQRRRLRDGWTGLRPHEHLVHFTPATLRQTFAAAGIEPVLVRSPAYVGPPQSLDQALWDLVRPHGRLRRALAPLCRAGLDDAGAPQRYPTPPAWALLRLVEAVYDIAGAGAVVLCVGRVS